MQGGDEHLSRCSEPDTNEHAVHLNACSSLRQCALCPGISTLDLNLDASRDHTDNSKPDHTANNDNCADCRMLRFWMGHEILQHSPPHVVVQA